MHRNASGDGPSIGQTTGPKEPVESLFYTQRIPNKLVKWILIAFSPLGLIFLIIRSFVGVHAFIVACLLRKSTAIRSIIMRIMCAVLGIVVINKGKREETARVLAANHVTALDHMAVDLVSPCLLPSVWDIPAVIRWCFGYVDLGASRSRNELIRRAKEHVTSDPLPLLAFPEGLPTSGKVALIKFNKWAFEVTNEVQPVALTAYRPFLWPVSVTHISSTWWADLIWFFALPFTVISVNFLPPVRKGPEETVESFATKVSQVIAEELKLRVSEYDNRDAAEAFKNWTYTSMRRQLEQSKKAIAAAKVLEPRELDETAMRIKQSNPSFHLASIREDLEKTKNQVKTLENIKNGKVSKEGGGKINSDSWKCIFNSRKWQMIENNRQKYLTKAKSS